MAPNPDAVHRYPAGDLVDHELVGDGCVCGVRVEAVPRDDGSTGSLIVHHSLDGREGRETATRLDSGRD